MTRRKFFISVLFVAIWFGMCFNEGLTNPVSYPSSYSYKEDSPSHPIAISNSAKIPADSYKTKKVFGLKAPEGPPTSTKKVPNALGAGSKLHAPAAPAPAPALIKVKKTSWSPINRKQFDDPNTRKKLLNSGAIHNQRWDPIRRYFDDPKSDKKQHKLKVVGAKKSLKAHQRQNDDDDDDDDDGGEYEGAAGADNNAGSGSNGKKSMPMTIIRGFDVIAMDMPIGQQSCKQQPVTEAPPEPEDVNSEETDDIGEEPPQEEVPEEPSSECTTTPQCSTTEPPPPPTDSCLSGDSNQKVDGGDAASWGDWSGCSKSCGVGVQSRSRVEPTGNAELDTEFRACHMADCPEAGYDSPSVASPQFGYRVPANTDR